MNFAVIGVNRIWFFQSSSKKEARQRANFIYFADSYRCSDVLHGISSCDGVWEARGYQVDNPIKIAEGLNTTIISGRPVSDAIYITRIQKERR